MSTKRFLLQKILQLFLTLFLVTAITFILMKLSPIDAAEAYARRVFTVDNSRIELIREEMGLNRPLVVQYLDWLGDLLHLDLGTSLVDNKDVFLIVGTAAKETACVVLLATVFQAVGALILGTLLYLARKNFVGKVLGFISIAAISIPAFYLATSFIDDLVDDGNKVIGQKERIPSATAGVLDGGTVSLCDLSVLQEQHDGDRFTRLTDRFKPVGYRGAKIGIALMLCARFDGALIVEEKSGASFCTNDIVDFHLKAFFL